MPTSINHPRAHLKASVSFCPDMYKDKMPSRAFVETGFTTCASHPASKTFARSLS